ncbi:MAG: sigma factor-like helix-turn-helix DNA-binding protein, partial [Candidatus Sulfotelmatobacter sp.]
SEGCRQIFDLHEVEGYQHHEIAQMLDCSVGNSKSQLHKAKMKMRDLLFPKRRVLRRRAANHGNNPRPHSVNNGRPQLLPSYGAVSK